ncbi:MAG: hypothetical protein KGI25_03905 [Thaumarchaeota archaeon]|nr:hypothetical protein [Nitrososphaerota archaeon]
MVYRKTHNNCENGCHEYTAYIRIKNNWHKVGKYNTICGEFSSLIRSEEEGRRLASTASSLLQSEKIKQKQRKPRNSLRNRILKMYFPDHPQFQDVYTLTDIKNES